MQGEHSSRRLEELCRYDARYEFLARSCRPDHTTLARFRMGLGESLDELLARVCQKAEADGILKRRAMAVDGTKVAARTSQWKKHRERSEVEDAALEEAAQMVSHGKFLVGYNVQAAVDMDSTLVTGYFVSEEPNDTSLLKEVLTVVKKQSGTLPEKVVADRGYGTSANALAAKEAGVEGFLPSKERGRVAPFVQGEDGLFRCQAGHVPTQRTWIDGKRGNRPYLLLRVSRCRNCPHAKECPGKGHQREMKIQAQDASDEKHACVARCRSEEGKALLRDRGSTIERLFAELKGRFRFRRFSMFGKSKARIEFGIGVLAYNLTRLLSLLLMLLNNIPNPKNLLRNQKRTRLLQIFA